MPELGPTSESEEMYLITVARAVEEGTPEPVPVGAIAEALSVSATSVNEMIRKLADRDLLEYEPYRGVRLSERGRTIADRVLRTRRLWATFLADCLGFSPIAADDQACHLEHVTAVDAAERLAVFLGEPEADPLGRPIPVPAGTTDPHPVTARLIDMAVGHLVEVVSIEGSRRALSFLEAEGITTGVRLLVLGAGASGVLVQGDGPVHVSRELAATIHVRAGGTPDAVD
jgi:DtxR family Mn-dependent transcriptional regulator